MEAPRDKKKSVEEVTKDCQLRDGLFRIHLNREKGNIFLYVRKEQLGAEYIYFTHTVNGVVGAGHNRGRFGDESVFTISKSFDKLEFTKQNTAFYFDPQHPLHRAAKANITDAIMARETILAEDNGGYLIAAEPLFLRESMLQVKPNGAAVLGIFGGLASSTATTMMFSRHAATHGDLVRVSAIVILIANVMVMLASDYTTYMTGEVVAVSSQHA